MSETTALEAPPEVNPETETVQSADTEAEGVIAPESTDGATEAQAEETTDPILAAMAEGDAADSAAVIEAEVQRRLREARGEEQKQAVKAKHQEALAKANELAESLGIADEAQPLFDLANAAHMEALEQARVAYEAAFRGLVPESAREAFDKQWEGRTDPVPPEEYLDAVMETRALEAKAVKEMSLEDLLKRSAKARADLRKLRPDKEEDDPRYKAGREQGRQDPAGEAAGNEQRAPQGNGKLSVEEASSLPIAQLIARRRAG